MINLLISGINGAMGKALLTVAKDYNEVAIVAGLDISASSQEGINVYSSFSDVKEKIDVVVDFSNPSLLVSLLDFCKNNNAAAVICTTGYSKEQEDMVKEASLSIPILRSANMSLGVNLVAHLAKIASNFLGSGYDVEIVEKHHRRKVDAPSGTALMLANEINSVNDDEYNYAYERESVKKSREPKEIGIHSIRGGTIVGEHEVIFAGTDEVITISHSISSRTVFAVGAIKSAIFISTKTKGLYKISDILE